LLSSTNLKFRTEATFCVSHVLSTLDVTAMKALVTEKFPTLLQSFFKNMLLTSDRNLVGSVLDVVELMCQIDRKLGLEGPLSFAYLMETSECLDHLEQLQHLGDEQIAGRAEYLVATYLSNE